VSIVFLKVLEGTSVTPEKTGFLIIWEFTVRPGKESKFEAAYGPEGIWARFFLKGKGYRTTNSGTHTGRATSYGEHYS